MSNSSQDSPHCSTATGSKSKALDAALLNGHLEWLLNVGFSADMILKWAKEKQPREDDSPMMPDPSEPLESHLNSLHDSSYDEGLSQSQSQSQDSPFTPATDVSTSHTERTSLSTEHVRQRKRKRSSHDKSASSAKKQRLTERSLFGDATTNRQKKVRMRKLMLRILSKLESHPDAVNFIHFDKADDYDDVIKYPMCLQEIKDRINRFQCDTRELFCAEFDDIIKNCLTYYKDDPAHKAQAKRLKTKFDELVKKYLPNDSHLQILEEGLPLDDSSDEGEAERGSGSSSSSDEEAEEDSPQNEGVGSKSCMNGDDEI